MSRRIPDFYLHLGGTHIHHLNYGIFLLAAAGAYLLFGNPAKIKYNRLAFIYGIGMALTFDEFGMWVHLGGSYWQRASLDAIGVLSALLGLMAFAPSLKYFRPKHWFTATVIFIMVIIFFVLLFDSFRYVGNSVGPKLKKIEALSPP